MIGASSHELTVPVLRLCDSETLDLLEGSHLNYSATSTQASLSIDKVGRATTAAVILEWNTGDTPSASSFRYGFCAKNTLEVFHYLGKVPSAVIRIAFVRALDVDECLACLPAERRCSNRLTTRPRRRPLWLERPDRRSFGKGWL